MFSVGRKSRLLKNLTRASRGGFKTFCFQGLPIDLTIGRIAGAKRQVVATREDLLQELELFAASLESTDGLLGIFRIFYIKIELWQQVQSSIVWKMV